jgi:hypothetical protein
MGYNARNDEIHENLERMRREREAYEDALAIVRQFNARLSAKKTAWFWPTIAAALASKHHWFIIACDACDTVIDLDLTVKRRHPDAPIRGALNDVRCPRCNRRCPRSDSTSQCQTPSPPQDTRSRYDRM